MTTIKFNQARAYIDGRQSYITLRLPSHTEFQKAKKLTMKLKDVLYQMEIKEHKTKRSLDANAYLWILCEKLSKKLCISQDEIYRSHILDAGVSDTFIIEQEALQRFTTAWTERGTGWLVEIKDTDGIKKYVTAYYGSSTYDTKQMSRLIDAVVRDCKDADIETMTPNELSRLLGAWHEK